MTPGGTHESGSAPRTLRSGFLRSLAAFPERIALEVDGEALSYAELAARAGALAETLRRHVPAGGPKLTAVFGQRSSTVYAGILGALLRGDGYVPLNPGFPLERTRETGLTHTEGVVSMARAGADSATSDFFICIGDQRSLDFGGARNADGQGFAAFGRVVRGMDVVRAIQASPVREGSQTLDPPVAIVRAARK